MLPADEIPAPAHIGGQPDICTPAPATGQGPEASGNDLWAISTDLLSRCDVPLVAAFEQSEVWKRGWSRGFYGLSLDEGVESEVEELRRGYEAGRIAWLLALPPSPFD